jgi:hypothetical protein
MSLSSQFVKDFLNKNKNISIVTTHSAAWENFYISPYKVNFILNDINPEKRFTTAFYN